MTTIRIKSKLSPPSRVSAELSRNSSKKKLMNTYRSETLLTQDNKFFKTLQDSKAIHNVNLQIPSLNSPNLSVSTNKSKQKRQNASIKGFTSKISIKSSKDSSKTKKPTKDFTIRNATSEVASFVELSGFEQSLRVVDSLEGQLKKAMEENRKLRRIVEQEKINEDPVDELMKSFKSRLYRLLYD